MESQVEIFKSRDNKVELKVSLEQENVWLNRQQLAKLFDRDIKTIGKHINNVFNDNELEEKAVVAKFATTAFDGKIYQVDYYNLDVIISVGYRVKSQRGVQFRQWATQRLKEYLVQGYAINEKRLEETKVHFLKTLEDLKILTENNNLVESKDILSLIQSFSNTWFSLDKYDKSTFPQSDNQSTIIASAEKIQEDLQLLKNELIKKGEASELFAQEKKEGNLEGIFGTVFQTIFGQDAYPSLEEKAAHLLYFVIKNHPFNDGNKRSGAFCFIWLLQMAEYDFRAQISPQTLTTLTLLIAESAPEDKDKMIGIVKLILNS